MAKAVLEASPFADVIMALLTLPSALILKLYRRIGARYLPITTRALLRIGVYPIRKHYHEPLFDEAELGHSLRRERALPGLDFNLPGQLALLERFRHSDEVVAFVEAEAARTEEPRFVFGNGFFESGDAEFLYQFLRLTRPRKVIEIGCGHSTLVVHAALMRNREEAAQEGGNVAPEHLCIEPYERPWLEAIDGIELLRERIEDCSIDWETALQPGDLLFIDSSHVIRPQGDVVLEYLDILPRLASGVNVHVHDIFTPRDYLDDWVITEKRFWNELYLLEATLGNQGRYEILAALNLLKHRHYDALKAACPYLTPDRDPVSFYFRIR